jgi:hypothetical protein
MKLSPEIIRERMFESFKKDVKKFYKDRENGYMADFEAKVMSGVIDVNASNYREEARKRAEEFMATRPEALLAFIKNYVHTNFDIIADAVEEGIMDKETAEVSMEVLKHILIAGEMDADPETKLK